MSSSLLLDDRLLLFLILAFLLFFSFLSLDLLLLLLLVIVISRDLLRLRDLLWLFEALFDFFELFIRFLKSFGDRCRDFLRLLGLDTLLDRVDLSLGDVLLLGLFDDLSLLSLSPLLLLEA